MNHVVQFSGGLGSWGGGRLVADRLAPGDAIVLLFADTRMEDEDLYRFLDDAAADVLRAADGHGRLARIGDGRTPWQVFRDVRYLGNARINPCSRVLKRDLLGIAIPRLYRLGFAHNNCGGFCVKAGQASHALLYRTLPDRARWHARQEQRLRRELGKDIAILRDRRGEHTRPLALAELHRRIDVGTDATDPRDIGGWGCAL